MVGVIVPRCTTNKQQRPTCGVVPVHTWLPHHTPLLSLFPATPRRPDQHEESHPEGAVSVPMYRLIDMGQADFAKVGLQGQLK